MRLHPTLQRFDMPRNREFVKYTIVGASNTLITFIIFTAAYKLADIHYLVALIIGYVAGSLNSYVLNRHWTFRAGHIAHSQAGTRFAAVQAPAIVINAVLLHVFVHDLKLPPILSQAILTVPVLLVTFFINRAWAFAHPEPGSEQP